MAIRQLSVLCKNEKGSLVKVLRVLSENSMNLKALSIADTEQYGILRILTSEPDRAKEILTGEGYTASLREVVAVSVPDEPGSLARVLTLFAENDINLEYMYSVIHGGLGRAGMVFRVDDNEKTEKLLSAAGYRVLSETDV